MLKEYRFLIEKEYYKFDSGEVNKVKYSVNDHEISSNIYDTLLNKVSGNMPLETIYNTYWRNIKTGSHIEHQFWTFSKEP